MAKDKLNAEQAKEVEAHEKVSEITEAGDIGDESLPAGEVKTDKQKWNYGASKVEKAELPEKLEEFIAGL